MLFFTENDSNWEMGEPFKITTEGSVRYGYFKSGCKCLYLESTKPLKLPTDSETLPPGEGYLEKLKPYLSLPKGPS